MKADTSNDVKETKQNVISVCIRPAVKNHKDD